VLCNIEHIRNTFVSAALDVPPLAWLYIMHIHTHTHTHTQTHTYTNHIIYAYRLVCFQRLIS